MHATICGVARGDASSTNSSLCAGLNVTRLSGAVGLASLIVIACGLLAPSPAAAILSPNDSIFFFKSGHAMSGTLVNGVFTKTKTYTMNGAWTAAAASRDTLLLYNQATGAAKTGTLRGGVFTPVSHFVVPTGYKIAAASCTSAILYDPVTGSALEGELTGGKFQNRQVLNGAYDAGWTAITSSCTTMYFENRNTSVRAWGIFQGGVFSQIGSSDSAINGRIDAATLDTFLDYDYTGSCPSPICGFYGLLSSGAFSVSATLTGFSTFNHIAGTSDSLLFYRSKTGVAASAILAAGDYSYVGAVSNLGTGWQLITGGR
jgi:hypothetical protein